MALSIRYYKDYYDKYSIEELLSMYEKLKQERQNRELEIKRYINGHMYGGSSNFPDMVLKQTIEEKIGKPIENIDYYKVTFDDIFNYIILENKDMIAKSNIKSFFDKLDDCKEKDKILFLLNLYFNQEEKINFLNEIKDYSDYKNIYEKYKKIGEEWYIHNQLFS